MFLNKEFKQKFAEHTVPQKNYYSFTVTQYAFSLFVNMCTKKHQIYTFSLCKFKILFKLSTRLANFFTFKDKIALCLHSKNYLQQFACARCNATYYYETYCHSKGRVSEHSSVPSLTNKQSKSMKVTPLKDHMLMCNHVVTFDSFRVLASSNSEFHLISRKNPILNKNEAFLPLHFFDQLQSHLAIQFYQHLSIGIYFLFFIALNNAQKKTCLTLVSLLSIKMSCKVFIYL